MLDVICNTCRSILNLHKYEKYKIYHRRKKKKRNKEGTGPCVQPARATPTSPLDPVRRILVHAIGDRQLVHVHGGLHLHAVEVVEAVHQGGVLGELLPERVTFFPIVGGC